MQSSLSSLSEWKGRSEELLWCREKILLCLLKYYTVKSHVRVMYAYKWQLCLLAIFPLPVFLFTYPLSVTFVCAPCSLSCLIIVGERVESLFLVGAPDRGCACSGSSPGEERRRVSTKRWAHSWGKVSVLPSAGGDEVSSGVIGTLAEAGFVKAKTMSSLSL